MNQGIYDIIFVEMGYLEDRKFQRFVCGEDDLIINERLYAKCGDISKGGLFILSNDTLQEGTKIKVYLASHAFAVTAVVKHSQPGFGMGVQFVPASDDEKKKIEDLIANILFKPQNVKYKLQILLIDHDIAGRSEVKKKLAGEGFSVTEASDGLDAVKKMNAYPTNAIVVSSKVRKLTLLQFLTTVREASWYNSVPIIVYSKKDDPDYAEKALELGASRFLSCDDASPEAISTAIRRILYNR